MRVSNEGSTSDVLDAFRWAEEVIGTEFDAKTALQEPQFRRDRMLALHFVRNFPLEAHFAAAREFYRNTGQLPPDRRFHLLYAFLIPAHRIFVQLSPKARTEFEGKMRGFVTGQFGIRPFAYEITMAMHLMSKGWDVAFADMEGIARFDFLATKDGAEIEMECKTTSGDTGRQIHRHEMSRLSGLIGPAMQELSKIAGSHFLNVTLPARLESSDAALQGAAETIMEAAQQRANATSPLATITYTHHVDLVCSGPQDHDDVHRLCRERFGLVNPHILIHGSPHHSAAIVAVTSERLDTVVKTLVERAKEAAKQCSGNRPAVIALNLVDPISRTELEGMKSSFNGLHAIAAGVFAKGKRLHIDTIAFTVPQTIQFDETGYTSVAGDVLTLNNPRPKFQCPAIRDLFKPISMGSAAPMAD